MKLLAKQSGRSNLDTLLVRRSWLVSNGYDEILSKPDNLDKIAKAVKLTDQDAAKRRQIVQRQCWTQEEEKLVTKVASDLAGC